MKETINKVVGKIRWFSDVVKANAEGQSEKAIEGLKEGKATIEAIIALLRAATISLTTLGEALRVVTGGGAGTAAARTLIKHILMDFGSRVNELGNVIQALGQDDQFVASLSDSQKAWEKAIPLMEAMDAEVDKDEKFVPGDRVTLYSSMGLPGRKAPPNGTRGTVKKVYRRDKVKTDDPVQAWVEDHLSKSVLKEVRLVLVEWDEYEKDNPSDVRIGSSFAIAPVDHIVMDARDNSDDADIVAKVKEGLESGNHGTVSGVFFKEIVIPVAKSEDDDPYADAHDLWEKLDSASGSFHLPEHAYGSTGYIDGLEPGDMPRPVVVGTDRGGRRFIAVRVKQICPKRLGDSDIGVETFFQRYTDATDVWTSGGDMGVLSGGRVKESDLEALTELIENGGVVITSEYCGKPHTRTLQLV